MTDEIHLKNYDLILNREGVDRALSELRNDLQSGKFNIDREGVATALHLPSDWDWSDVDQHIKSSLSPENRFNDLLAALYRAAPDESVVSPESYIRADDGSVYRRKKRDRDNDRNPKMN